MTKSELLLFAAFLDEDNLLGQRYIDLKVEEYLKKKEAEVKKADAPALTGTICTYRPGDERFGG